MGVLLKHFIFAELIIMWYNMRHQVGAKFSPLMEILEQGTVWPTRGNRDIARTSHLGSAASFSNSKVHCYSISRPLKCNPIKEAYNSNVIIKYSHIVRYCKPCQLIQCEKGKSLAGKYLKTVQTSAVRFISERFLVNY
jgi:hypothetical protein